MLRRADNRAQDEGRPPVLDQSQTSGGCIDHDPIWRRMARQPAPSLEVGSDLPVAGLCVDVQGGKGFRTDAAVNGKPMTGLKMPDRLLDRFIEGAVAGPTVREVALHRQAPPQELHSSIGNSQLQGRSARHRRPSAILRDTPVAHQRLPQPRIFLVGRGKRAQP